MKATPWPAKIVGGDEVSTVKDAAKKIFGEAEEGSTTIYVATQITKSESDDEPPLSVPQQQKNHGKAKGYKTTFKILHRPL